MYLPTIKEDELKDGSSKAVIVNDKKIVLFRDAGALYAVDNICPHEGAPLADGFCEGGIVTCPLHGWQFDGKTGRSMTGNKSIVAYQVRVADGLIEVDV